MLSPSVQMGAIHHKLSIVRSVSGAIRTIFTLCPIFDSDMRTKASIKSRGRSNRIYSKTNLAFVLTGL